MDALVTDQSPVGYTAWDEIELDEEVAQKINERGNRKLTRELKGSYVDNQELKDEVCSSSFVSSRQRHGALAVSRDSHP